MPIYVRKVLDRLQHPNPKRPQYAAHCWSVPAYGKILQITPDTDKSNILEKKGHQDITVHIGDHALL